MTFLSRIETSWEDFTQKLKHVNNIYARIIKETNWWKTMSEVNWETMPKPKPQVSDIIVLEKGEEILTSWDGSVESIMKSVITKGRIIKRRKVVEAKEKGTLVLTNRIGIN